ncbi:tRNA (N6-isopentenyl adenosine(37)-C2)-methylthiotransferase MiaB [Clostridium autoethanogenum]|uniref:tRNA-2-methylthio-N(6)-dimethylallyladenosine synthase n=2 Tax=Clostridium TaxID=1485 RepID=D8GJM4_CLOLD|nr:MULTISPECIES: tRNA (N6-isopentenyl adenosine(37)-C2)-methylthiotransferase MiaB [Clostridium]ADK15185.1 putative MiaB protein [Clostridium ljungdahlii DSM 13528]OAA88665.1 (Dimethylallyl)adenosine tRNA methylthiotransferase MiaB [Clostridium ljungdahlii DSM 13528]RMD02443.1 tRNA (N6-isopentenyl adenosine(37)-C2)-methylthiotransferase MiaB [Clostridium autoethanogenum]
MINNVEKATKNFFIETWGCQMNEEDSEKLSGMLKRLGYKRTEDRSSADLIIFNTCCVRENAELKVYGNLGMLKKLKIKNPNLIIAICGCMMQQKDMAKNIIKRFPFVDIIFGTHNAYKFPEYLNRVQQENTSVIEIQDKESGIVEGLPIDRESNVKAFVTITYGCNNFCTYCIVPYVRGRERSRKPEDIEKEIKELISKGYKEITLLGQNVNSYGKTLEPKVSFSDLLRRINSIDGVERIRFMTSQPKDLTEDVVDAVAECSKVCEQIHLPVQSGSTSLLKKMNRSYSKEGYLNLVKMIREKVPDAAITTDIIVGFPGETEEDFEETLNLAREVQYDSAFTFIYSKRKGTPAYDFEDQIPEDIKHERFNRLVEVINESSARKNKDYEGRTEEILVEGTSKNDNTKLTGRTRSGKLVNFKGNKKDIGKLVKVQITKATSFSLLGEEIQ